MDLKLLEQFVEIAKHGSFGQASRELYINQPTLTRNIRKLEEEIGVRLFDRGPKGAVLTHLGERFLPYAQSMLGEAERAAAELQAVRGLQTGQVRIGLSPNFLSAVMPDAIAALLAAAPDVNVQVTSGTHETLSRLLRGYELDLVLEQIAEVTYGSPGGQQELKFEPLFDLTYHVYAPAAHPLAAGGERIGLEVLAAQRWAIPHQLSLSYRFENSFFRAGLKPPVQSVNSASLTFLRTAMLRFGLLAILPDDLLAADLASGAVRRLVVPELRLTYQAGLLTRRSGASTPVMETLMDAIRRIARRG